MKTVTEHLLALADAGNAAFTARLAPGVDPDRMLGCRIPQLRRLARTLRGTPEAAAFLTQLPHRYYDENNLHGILLGHIRPTGEALDALERHHNLHAFLIERIRDYDTALAETERFLPYIDNWATCDITACGMKTLGRAPAAALPRIYEWLASRRTYTVRFGVVALLAHYLDEKFDTHHLDRLTSLPGGEYYVDMAVAWAFSVALVKHFEQTLPYFTQRRLDRRVHNKALQKGRESLRIDDARKTILQRLKY